jgi:hypothetical protein
LTLTAIRPDTAEVADIVLDPDEEGNWPPVSLATGQKHKIVTRMPQLELEFLYHDDGPVYEAPFTLELNDGSKIEGKLDAAGKATVKNLTSLPKRVQFGPDQRPWKRKDEEKNPDYKEQFSSADAEALVDQYLKAP